MKRSMRGVAALVAATLAMLGGNVWAQTLDKPANPQLVSERDRTSYALGVGMGTVFERERVNFDEKTFERGFSDGLAGKDSPFTESEVEELDVFFLLGLLDPKASKKPAVEQKSMQSATNKAAAGALYGYGMANRFLLGANEIDVPMVMLGLRTALAKESEPLLTEREMMVELAAFRQRMRKKLSYAIGMDVAQSFEPVVEFIDLASFERAVRNAFDGRKPLLSESEAKATDEALRMNLAARQNKPVGGLPPGSQLPAPSKEKVGLMLGGYAVGPSLKPLKDEIDLHDMVMQMRTVFSNEKSLISEDDAKQAKAALATMSRRSLARIERDRKAANNAEGAAFLTRNKSEKGVVTTPSGLQYMVLRPGNGARPTPASRVRVNYEGKLLDGTVFDSSYQRGEPLDFSLGQVIKGWTEGVSLMPVGSKYRFWIPSNLAYGPAGTQGGPIGPDATLTFDVELLGILQ